MAMLLALGSPRASAGRPRGARPGPLGPMHPVGSRGSWRFAVWRGRPVGTARCRERCRGAAVCSTHCVQTALPAAHRVCVVTRLGLAGPWQRAARSPLGRARQSDSACPPRQSASVGCRTSRAPRPAPVIRAVPCCIRAHRARAQLARAHPARAPPLSSALCRIRARAHCARAHRARAHRARAPPRPCSTHVVHTRLDRPAPPPVRTRGECCRRPQCTGLHGVLLALLECDVLPRMPPTHYGLCHAPVLAV